MLDRVLRNNHVLFLGYSGNDIDIYPYLFGMAENARGFTWSTLSPESLQDDVRTLVTRYGGKGSVLIGDMRNVARHIATRQLPNWKGDEYLKTVPPIPVRASIQDWADAIEDDGAIVRVVSSLLIELGEPYAANMLLKAILPVHRQVPHEKYTAWLTFDLGRAHAAMRNSAVLSAEVHFRDAIKYFTASHNQRGVALAYCHLGDLFARFEFIDHAERNYRRAADLLVDHSHVDWPNEAAEVLLKLSRIHDKKGDRKSATRNVSAAAKVGHETGDQHIIAASYQQRGDIASRAGDVRAATKWYEKELWLRQKVGPLSSLLRVNTALGRLYSGFAKWKEAEACISTVWVLQTDPAEGGEAIKELRHIYENMAASVDGMQQILRGVESPYSVARQVAAEVLGRSERKAVWPRLCSCLSDPATNVRAAAAQALGILGARQASKCLSTALKDSNFHVRKAAARSLHQIGSKRSFSQVMDILTCNDANARASAAETLGKLADERAVDDLCQVAATDSCDEVRLEAVGALGAIGSPVAIPVLIALLCNENRRLRASAASALGNIGQNSAGSALCEALIDEEVIVRADAVEALGRLNDSEMTEPIIEMFGDTDRIVRRAAVRGLKHLGSQRAMKGIANALNDVDEYVRSDCTAALEELNWKVSQDSIGGSFWVAKGNWAEACNLGDAAVPALVRELRHAQITKKPFAAESLGKIGGPAAVDALMASLESDDLRVRDTSVRALGKAQARQAVPQIVTLLRDTCAKVRLTASDVLVTLGWSSADDESEAYLLVAAQSFQEVLALGEAAVPALANAVGEFRRATVIVDSDGIPGAFARPNDEDWDIRVTCAIALVHLEMRVSIPLLRSLIRMHDWNGMWKYLLSDSSVPVSIKEHLRRQL